MDLKPGMELTLSKRHYRLEAQIGAGSFGKVWRATETYGGATYEVVIKILPIVPGGEDSESVDNQRARRELEGAVAMASLNCPYLVSARDAGWADPEHRTTYLLAMNSSWHEGAVATASNLYDWARLGARENRQPLSQAQVAQIAYQMTLALDHLHRIQGVVHRDVKTANILVFQHEHQALASARLGDFGSAWRINRDALPLRDAPSPRTGQCSPPVTWEYMPPEVIRHVRPPEIMRNIRSPEVTRNIRSPQRLPFSPATDFYALGVVLWELLVYRRPSMPAAWLSQEGAAEEMLPSIAMEFELQRTEALDEALAHFVNALLTFEPDDRLHGKAAVKQAKALNERFVPRTVLKSPVSDLLPTPKVETPVADTEIAAIDGSGTETSGDPTPEQSKTPTLSVSHPVDSGPQPATPAALVDSRPQPETPAAAVQPRPQPETPAAAVEPRPQPETPAAAVEPRPQPETPAAAVEPWSQPETPATAVEPWSQPETPAAAVEPRPQPETPADSVSHRVEPRRRSRRLSWLVAVVVAATTAYLSWQFMPIPSLPPSESPPATRPQAPALADEQVTAQPVDVPLTAKSVGEHVIAKPVDNPVTAKSVGEHVIAKPVDSPVTAKAVSPVPAPMPAKVDVEAKKPPSPRTRRRVVTSPSSASRPNAASAQPRVAPRRATPPVTDKPAPPPPVATAEPSAPEAHDSAFAAEARLHAAEEAALREGAIKEIDEMERRFIEEERALEAGYEADVRKLTDSP